MRAIIISGKQLSCVTPYNHRDWVIYLERNLLSVSKDYDEDNQSLRKQGRLEEVRN